MTEISSQLNVRSPALAREVFHGHNFNMAKTSTQRRRGPYKTEARQKIPDVGPIYLLQWRVKRGLTQEQLADRAGVSPGTVSGIEKGTSGWSPQTLAKLARALQVSRGMLLEVDPSQNEPLWSIVDRATADQQEQIGRIGRALIEDGAPTPKRRT